VKFKTSYSPTRTVSQTADMLYRGTYINVEWEPGLPSFKKILLSENKSQEKKKSLKGEK